MVLQGKNGAANYTSMFQSAKLINEQGGKKGEENIENPPEESSVKKQNSQNKPEAQ